jgi:glycosyltransferase involved in cell wall biosynthesis
VKPKVFVVMPAWNAARTLERTVASIPRDCVDELLLVDDKSTDDTVSIAQKLPELHVIWHPHNAGYGANQKTCYLHALNAGADVVVMLHPDGQYEPGLIPDLIAPIVEGRADMVLGSRLAEPGAAIAGGMPRWKWVANRGLTILENRMMRTQLSELHSGYRAYSRELLLKIPFLRNSDDFSFDSEVLTQATHFGFRIAEVPTRTIYDDDASSVGFRAGVVYGLKTLRAVGVLALHRRRLIRSRKLVA